jgi:hypothetical protein
MSPPLFLALNLFSLFTLLTIIQHPSVLCHLSSGFTLYSCMKLRKVDGLAKSRKTPFSVIPAEAGIQSF